MEEQMDCGSSDQNGTPDQIEEVEVSLNPEDEESEEVVKNPLNHEVVLRNLLSFLPLNDLKSCRLVNSLWNSSSIPYLKRSCVCISFNNDYYWEIITNHGIEDMAQFIQCMERSINFPYVKLDVGTSIVKKLEDKKVLQEFFKVIGPVLTEIMIRDEWHEWGNDLFTPDISENIVFPCLKVFELTPANDDDVAFNFQFLTNILANAPVLDKLACQDYRGVDGRAITCFLESITAANCLQFSTLEISGQIDDDHLIYMSQMGLKLKMLYIGFFGSRIHEKNLKLFLQSQSTTLQRLKMADFSYGANYSVDFPCMKTLKYLAIKGRSDGRIRIAFPNISYVKQFPVLKRLSFPHDGGRWNEFLKFGIQPVTTVQELRLPAKGYAVTSLQYAVHIFPNIKLLEIAAKLELVNFVYDSMPNVEELILNTGNVDTVDDIITGLSKSECQEILSSSEEMFQKVERDHLSIITTKPMFHLQKLKKLGLRCRYHPWFRNKELELTDVSCRLVLMKMKSLQCLNFYGRIPPTNRISKEVLADMKKRMMVLC